MGIPFLRGASWRGSTPSVVAQSSPARAGASRCRARARSSRLPCSSDRDSHRRVSDRVRHLREAAELPGPPATRGASAPAGDRRRHTHDVVGRAHVHVHGSSGVPVLSSLQRGRHRGDVPVLHRAGSAPSSPGGPMAQSRPDHRSSATSRESTPSWTDGPRPSPGSEPAATRCGSPW